MKNISLILIVTSFFIAMVIWVAFLTNNKCNNGKNHVYRGQPLCENVKPILAKLSARASYLNTTQKVDERIKDTLEQMINDAEKDGMCLVVVGSFRSYEQQSRLFDTIADKSKVAKPGESEHQTGLAVDLNACPMKDGVRDDSIERLELQDDFETLPEYKWLQDNAYKYNFVQSYTLENSAITGYPVESWHWKYIIK
jgi:zinc D-Ala-D-Ala carboxypeptidase